MYDVKPAASLTGDLLARKGQARPALNHGLASGDDDSTAFASRRVITLPRPEPARAAPPPPPPPVAEVSSGSEEKTSARRRVAFTYRLDPERHLNLRVVAIYKRTSGQKILDEALDRYLEEVMTEEGSLVFLRPGARPV